jgi:hypothetical protein
MVFVDKVDTPVPPIFVGRMIFKAVVQLMSKAKSGLFMSPLIKRRALHSILPVQRSL